MNGRALWRSWIGLVSLACLTSCHPAHRISARAISPAFEGVVPGNFQRAAEWNSKDICPDGALLTPMTRFEADASQVRNGYDHYFGRSCQIVVEHEAEDGETDGRGPATEGDERLYTVPHGRFVLWWPNGAVMREGAFFHGTVSGQWNDYDPDGNRVVR